MTGSKFLTNNELNPKEIFLFIFIFSSLFALPLILSNTLYMDDQIRIVSGEYIWEKEGRILTKFIYQLLEFGSNGLYNVFPLSLIIGLLFFSFSVCYAFKHISLRSTIINIFPFLFLICNPLFLQNISYQFDSIGHLMSVGLVVFAFFYGGENKSRFALIPILLLTASALFYQPTINLYIPLICLDLWFNVNKNNLKLNVVDKLKTYLIVYCLSLLLYYVIYTLYFKVYLNIEYERNQLIGFTELLYSYRISIDTLWEIIKDLPMLTFAPITLIGALLVLFKITQLIYSIKNSCINRKTKTLSILTYIFGITLLFFSIWGPFILLKEKFFNPRDFVSCGGIVMLLVYAIILSLSFDNDKQIISKKGDILNKIIVNVKLFVNYACITIIALFYLNILSLSYAYGNALKYNAEYTQYINNNISEDLLNDNFAVNKKIFAYGRLDEDNKTKNILKLAPFLRNLLYPDNSNFFKTYSLYDLKIEPFDFTDNLKEWKSICSNNNSKIVKVLKRKNYNIYEFESHISIWYKPSEFLCDKEPTDRINRFKSFYQKQIE